MSRKEIIYIINSVKFGKGIIRSKKDAMNYIKFGYNPYKLLKNFKIIDNFALQYVLAEAAKSKVNLN